MNLTLKFGGNELLQGKFDQGMETLYKAHYYEIKQDTYIVFAHDMYINKNHHSVSLAIIEIMPKENGTTMLYTEHVVDGTLSEKVTSSHKTGASIHFDRIEEIFFKNRSIYKKRDL
ncbi:MAG: SRPBCC domain-containing protein [Alphaproteobacteria bacterium]|nr:SRPBCC domain-containing protein [Alphaproteobacteria bacterium]